MNFRFSDIPQPSQTVNLVRAHLAASQGCLVYGRRGTGKTRAVHEAVQGRRFAWVDVQPGATQVDRFFADLAPQLPQTEIVAALRGGNLADVTALASEALGDTCLVVDRAERLRLSETWSWDDPIGKVVSGDQLALKQWLFASLEQLPVVLISRRSERHHPSKSRVHHRQPQEWILKLEEAPEGFRDWPAFNEALGDSPMGQVVGRTFAILTDAKRFEVLVEDLHSDDHSQSMEVLLEALARELPGEWVRILGLLSVADGLPEELARRVAAPRGFGDPIGFLRDQGLIDERQGRLHVLPAIAESPAFSLAANSRERALRQVAGGLLEEVSELGSPTRENVEWIVRAHELYCEIGDFEQARRTALFHLDGLVVLARAISRGGNHSEAAQVYASIEPMVPPDSAQDRLRSYLVHYKHWNRSRPPREEPPSATLAGYRAATELWPQNALWWQREIEQLLGLDRGRDAVRRADEAASAVKPHPKRELFLRIRPALSALRSPQPIWGIRLATPVFADPPEDWDSRRGLESLVAAWAGGLNVSELTLPEGVVVLRQPERMTLTMLDAHAWMAEWPIMQIRVRGSDPVEAFTGLALEVVQSVRRLLSAFAHTLSEDELLQKGQLIGRVDLVHSDLGLESPDRWLAGRFEESRFLFAHADLDPVDLSAPPELIREDALYLARFRTDRAGLPKGLPLEWKLVGKGRSREEVLALYEELTKGEG